MIAQQVAEDFVTKLRALCEEFDATIDGYTERGEDVRIEAFIPSVYDEQGNAIRECAYIRFSGQGITNTAAYKLLTGW